MVILLMTMSPVCLVLEDYDPCLLAWNTPKLLVQQTDCLQSGTLIGLAVAVELSGLGWWSETIL
jgi:hypothetical protein